MGITKEQYEAWKGRLVENLEAALAEIPENPLMESYAARNAYNYLQCLALLEKMQKEE